MGGRPENIPGDAAMALRPVPTALLAATGAAALAGAALLSAAPGAAAGPIPPPPAEKTVPKGDQVAVLAGGCFWGSKASMSMCAA
jgi:peptide-methionine (S)-S-oxide reductase